ncbi:MAG: EAL domain-containing protein [Clostridiaceae bacterium]|nr:EAL domain-containing protein [Clostridiaceae bacterium]
MQTSLPNRNGDSNTWYILKVSLVLILIFTATCFVYCTGGVHHSFTHFMYIPIILSAYYFQIKGAVVAALLGGFALGPFMPQQVSSGLMQHPASWIFRIAIFVMIGIICSLLFKHIKKVEMERSYINIITGFPNINKLKVDLDELIDKKVEFSLIGFDVVNINSIKQNISYEMGIRSLKKAFEILSESVNSTIYSIDANRFAAVLLDSSVENAQTLGEHFLSKTIEPFLIDQFRIGLLIKGGIVNFPLQAEDSDEMIKKMGLALDHATEEIGLYVYDDIMEQQSKSKTELVPHLLYAIQNEEFSLVYQPKGNLNGDNTISVEALLRWNHPTRGQISPGEFINIAEEIGIIGEITKWVIKNVIDQEEKWKKAGMSIKIALNISPKDFDNQSVMDLFTELIENEERDLSLLEIELTERCILKNQEIVI